MLTEYQPAPFQYGSRVLWPGWRYCPVGVWNPWVCQLGDRSRHWWELPRQRWPRAIAWVHRLVRRTSSVTKIARKACKTALLTSPTCRFQKKRFVSIPQDKPFSRYWRAFRYGQYNITQDSSNHFEVNYRFVYSPNSFERLGPALNIGIFKKLLSNWRKSKVWVFKFSQLESRDE